LTSIGGLPKIDIAAPTPSTTGRQTQHLPPVFPDTLASAGSQGLGFIRRIVHYCLEMITSLFSYKIEKKTEEQVMDDFDQIPSKVFEALLKFYRKDENAAEKLLLSIAEEIKKMGPQNSRQLAIKINEAVYKMVFPPNILKIQDKIIMAEAEFSEVEKFQAEEKKFNTFLKCVMVKLSEQSALSSMKEHFPKDCDWSFGEFIRVLLEKNLIQKLKYQGSFKSTRKLIDRVLVEVLLIQRGDAILVDQYPRLKQLIHPIRAIVTDPFQKQRLWMTTLRLIAVYER